MMTLYPTRWIAVKALTELAQLWNWAKKATIDILKHRAQIEQLEGRVADLEALLVHKGMTIPMDPRPPLVS